MKNIASWFHGITEKRWLALEAIRVYLGLGLFVRGVLFITQPDTLLAVIRDSGDWFWPFAIAHFVAMAHLGGGLLLALGLFTRAAAVVQIPPVVGAVCFVHVGEGLFSSGQSLELSVLVLCLLVVFSIFGAGQLSADAQLEAQEQGTTAAGLRERHA